MAFTLNLLNLAAVMLLLTEVRPARGVRAVAGSVAAVPKLVLEGLGLLRSSHVLLALVLVELFWGFSMVTFEGLFPSGCPRCSATPTARQP